MGYPFSLHFSDSSAKNFFEIQWKQNVATTQSTPTKTLQFAAPTEKGLRRWLDFFSQTNSKTYSSMLETETASQYYKVSKEDGSIECKGNMLVFHSETTWSGHYKYWDQRQILCKFLPTKDNEEKMWEIIVQKR